MPTNSAHSRSNFVCKRVVRIVREAMEAAAALRVRLVTDCGVGDNWLEAH